MTEAIKITNATDPDAAYVLNRLAEAEQHDKQAGDATIHKARAKQARFEAGRRLIEVRMRLDNFGSDKNVSGQKVGRPTDPFRDWLRDNGIARETARALIRYASSTEEERAEQRRKDRERKRAEREATYRESWTDVLIRNKAIDPIVVRGGSHVMLNKKIAKTLGHEVPSYFTNEEDADKFAIEYVRAFPGEIEPRNYDLSESAQKKLKRAIAIEKQRLSGQFWKELYAEVDKRMPEIVAQREKEMEETREERKRYAIFTVGIKKKITLEEYRFLLQVLHPDRAPTGREAQYDKAFQIIMRLREYAEA